MAINGSNLNYKMGIQLLLLYSVYFGYQVVVNNKWFKFKYNKSWILKLILFIIKYKKVFLYWKIKIY